MANSNLIFFPSSSKLSPFESLTAAHCNIALITHAVFNRYDRSSNNNNNNNNENTDSHTSNTERRIPIRAERPHPQYHPRRLQHDVMVLILETAANPDDTTSNNDDDDVDNKKVIPYMALHQPSDRSLEDLATTMTTDATDRRPSAASPFSPPRTSLVLTAYGWGHTQRPPTGMTAIASSSTTKTKTNTNTTTTASMWNSEVLKAVEVSYVRNRDCQRSTDTSTHKTYLGAITDDMLCAWSPREDTCHEDSGGPLVLSKSFLTTTVVAADEAAAASPTDSSNTEENTYVQVGIISWGEDCADAIFPGGKLFLVIGIVLLFFFFLFWFAHTIQFCRTSKISMSE